MGKANIIIEPVDVYNYYKVNEAELHSVAKIIAENQKIGVKILITEDAGKPLFVVMQDDVVVYDRHADGGEQCREIARNVYGDYLGSPELPMSASQEMAAIDSRELELDEAVYDLLEKIAPELQESRDNMDEIYEGVKDKICEYLYKEFDVSVYRPMYLEDTDGSDFFAEYPYPEIDFTEEG